MALLRRPARLPSDAAAHLPAGERVLRSARLVDDSWLVVARDALLLTCAAELLARYGWDEIETGTWDGETGTLTVIWSDREREPQVFEPAETEVTVLSDITAAFRERVQASVVHAEIAEIGRTRVRATVRRRADGSLYSRLTAFGPLAGDETQLAEIDALERRVREAAGLAP